jgi:hypothetical protein
MIKTDDGKKAYMVFAGVWSCLFTVVVILVLSQEFWFHPLFGRGDQEVVATTAWSIGVLYVVSKIHEWIQVGLTKHRITDVSAHLWHFDVITSFAPIIAAVLTMFLQHRYFTLTGMTQTEWASALQILDCIIIFGATVADIVPTIKHMQKPTTSAPAHGSAPAAATANSNGHGAHP